MTRTDSIQGYYAFENIRYGLAPTGAHRFAKPEAPPMGHQDVQANWLKPPICPQAYPGWMCTKHATTYDKDGNAKVANFSLEWCRQAEEKVMRNLRQTEDCLFLDVFVPRPVFENHTDNRCPEHALAPIVVSFGTTPFIYGSKEEIGIGGPSPAVLTQHSPYPDEDSCATQYPIVVSINYRLGMFGWLAPRSGTANLGLWDQRLALEWVRQHAQIFGGDWDRITIVGMGSGGGGSAMHQLTAFGGKPNPNRAWYYQNDTTPFQRAIIMSPNWHFTLSFEGTFNKVLDAATNMTGSPITTLAQLKELATNTLMDINRKVVKEAPLNNDMFGPVPGGKFAPKHPSYLLRKGEFDPSLKVIVGRGLYHHLRTAPFGATAKEVRDQMPGLLHGYSNETMWFITESMYNNSVRDELAQWYKGKRTKRLSPSVFPLDIRDELHVMDEVMVGCNTNTIARTFGNSSFAYDAIDFSPNDMMGLFSTAINQPPMDNIPKPFSFRERFLRFINEGTPSVLGAWVPYGNEVVPYRPNDAYVLEKDHTSTWGANIVHDIYDNQRCHWWALDGYFKWMKQSGSEYWASD